MANTFSFKYIKDGEIKHSALEANSKFEALKKIKDVGINPLKITPDALLTIKGQFTTEFDSKDLVRLYNTIGNRINIGKSLIDGLEAAGEFMFDKRLKFAVLSMATQLRNGEKIYESMLKSGFSKIDSMVVRSSEASGKQAEAFTRMAKEVKRKSEITGSIKKIFIMPAITMFLIYVGCFIAPYAFGVNTEKQLKGLDISTSDFDTYFKIAHFSHDHLVMYLVFALVPLAVMILLFKNGTIAALLDKWGLWKSISVKSDMANAWTSFSQLWDSGVTPQNCAELTMESCERKDSKKSFAMLKKWLSQGKKIDSSVAQSAFPMVIVKGIKAADEGSAMSFPEGINSMCDELSLDVMSMVEILKAWCSVGSVVVGGAGILFFVYIALGPIYLTVLKNI